MPNQQGFSMHTFDSSLEGQRVQLHTFDEGQRDEPGKFNYGQGDTAESNSLEGPSVLQNQGRGVLCQRGHCAVGMHNEKTSQSA